MAGKLKYYTLFGLLGFLITFAVASSNNLFTTSLIRGLIAFVVWFGLSYAANWMIGFMKEMSPEIASEDRIAPLDDEGKGGQLDLTTPDETDELNELLKQPPGSQTGNDDFTPLNPPRLVKKPDDKDPEELAKVVRHLTEN
ncbi:hypothetical protein [Paenibacillus ihumii]|uniref:hypothetical protein n=1 Tax=Paenibacillus ihumii TaxID=687436 RepID=UPI0006D82F79|nr:hypothetical protein [Paenibacillus ihumii]